MNIVYPQENPVTAKTCGCQKKQVVTYAFREEVHGLCMDKKDIIRAEIEACEKLLRYCSTSDKSVIEKEIADLKTALDLMP
jgi:hypothetical protein